jgi:hypothetical protein
MNITRIALAATALAAILTGTATAKDRLFWERLPPAAYNEVYAYYCSPDELALASVAEPAPDDAAAVIYEDLFVFEYGSNCRDFYFQEVASRVDQPFEQEQGLVVVNR